MSNNSLTIKRIEKYEDALELSGIWNRLLDDTDKNAIELSFEWQCTYWKYFSQDALLYILVVEDADSVVAIAPLKISETRKYGLAVRSLEIIAAEESNYQRMLIGESGEEVLDCVFDYLQTHQSEWDILNLFHLLDDDPTTKAILEKAQKLGWKMRSIQDECAYLQLESTWQEYQDSLDKKRKHRVANRIRKAARELGNLELSWCKDSSQYEKEVEKFYDLHRKRWDETFTPSQFNYPAQCDFYREAGAKLLDRGKLNLYTLKAGWVTMGQLISFMTDEVALIQLIAYDPEFYKYSPMVILMELFVDEVTNQGIRMIDWGTYYDWKELWTNQLKPRVNIEFYPRKLRSFILRMGAEVYEGVREWVKKNEFLTKKFLSWRKKKEVEDLQGKGN